MKKSLSKSEYIYIASMLFGMFFGAGNLIFPVYMGQMAGRNMWPALIGFIITGVGLPLLGVAALGISRSSGLFELSSRIGRPYGYFFTCALYLTIGPFFAIPRCATTSFTVGIEQIIPQGSDKLSLYLLLFSLAFFVAALLFSLYPGKIMVWVGKILNPAFLLFLGILVVVTLVNPGAAIAEVEPAGDYATVPFFEGFIEGYNTLDALASLAFGIVVVNVIRGLGVEDGDAVASNTVRAGIFSCLLMAVIYFFGDAHRRTQPRRHGKRGKRRCCPRADRKALSRRAGAYRPRRDRDPRLPQDLRRPYHELCRDLCRDVQGAELPRMAIIFSVVAFGFANFGLSNIISYSLPVLMFLYPLAIVLIVLSLCGKFFEHDRRVYRWVIGFTFFAALYDLCASLQGNVISALPPQWCARLCARKSPARAPRSRLGLPRRPRSGHRPCRTLHQQEKS